MEPPEAVVLGLPLVHYNLDNMFSNDSAIIISVDENATLLFPAMMDPYTINAMQIKIHSFIVRAVVRATMSDIF